MLTVTASDGRIVNRSRNLAGIRRYVSNHLIQELHINAKADGQLSVNNSRGWLYIVFADGASYQTDFASFAVLKNFVRQWRNTYGASLWMNGCEAGKVSYNNRNLIVRD